MPNIRLQSFDKGEILEVELKAVKMCKLIDSMLTLTDPEDEHVVNDHEVIPILTVTSPILKKVMEWIEHHKDDSPLDDDDTLVTTDDKLTGNGWDAEFFNVDVSTLGAYIDAANYLDIKELLDLATAKVALIVKNCSSALEIRRTLSIQNTAYTAEEEDFMRQQKEWCTRAREM